MKYLFNLLCLLFVFKSQTQTVIKDIDGNNYTIVQIGNKTWFRENLRTQRLNDSTVISPSKNADSWQNIKTPAYCLFENDSSQYFRGLLYNGFAVKSGKLCPLGCRVPTYEDWQDLINNFGGEGMAGYFLRKPYDALDFELGFPETTLDLTFDGLRKYSGSFEGLEQIGGWWSSTAEKSEQNSNLIYTVQTVYWNNSFFFWLNTENDGLSVRCVCDVK